MLISKDIYRLDLFRDGTLIQELRRDSSEAFIRQLRLNDIIYIDETEGKVYLTIKGQAVRKIGFEKYLELEKVEQQYLTSNSSRLRLHNRLFLIFMILLILGLSYFVVSNPFN